MPGSRFQFWPIACAILLSACNTGAASAPVDDDLDTELAADTADPLLAAAVQDPLMSDPQLSARSNADAVRPPPQPYSAQIPNPDVAPTPADGDGALTAAPKPEGTCRACAVAGSALTLGALAARQDDAAMRRCGPALRYAAGWANTLQGDIPLPGGARVIEAAGTDRAGCRLRAARFVIARPVSTMLDWYYTRAIRIGYASRHGADGERHVLSGTRAVGLSYVIVLSDDGTGGTAIDLLTSGG